MPIGDHGPVHIQTVSSVVPAGCLPVSVGSNSHSLQPPPALNTTNPALSYHGEVFAWMFYFSTDYCI